MGAHGRLPASISSTSKKPFDVAATGRVRVRRTYTSSADVVMEGTADGAGEIELGMRSGRWRRPPPSSAIAKKRLDALRR